jgi:hypothetical protein
MTEASTSLAELANLRLYGLGWPSLTPETVTLYFSETGWEQTDTSTAPWERACSGANPPLWR